MAIKAGRSSSAARRAVAQAGRAEARPKLRSGDRFRSTADEPHGLAAAIHDDAVQVLDAVALRLAQASARVSDTRESAHVKDLAEEVRAAADRLRVLLLRSTTAPNHDLSLAIAREAEQLRAQGGFELELVDQLGRQPPRQQAESLVRIARELLTNVRKHAAADSAKMTLASVEGGVLLRVEDDGAGFDRTRPRTRVRTHAGLRLIERQVRQAGGRWSISSRPGQGTVVEVWLSDSEP
jgi:signal transduction histidine kinase